MENPETESLERIAKMGMEDYNMCDYSYLFMTPVEILHGC